MVREHGFVDYVGAVMYLAVQACAEVVRKLRRSMSAKKRRNGKFTRARKRIMWYWDVRLWTPVFILLLIGSVIVARQSVNVATVEIETEYVQADVEPQSEVAAVLSIEDIKLQEREEMIVELARLADSMAGHRSDDVKRAIMWVVINRSEDNANGYGRSVLDEISRPRQWQNYDPDAVYLEDTYDMAAEIVDTWMAGGARMFSRDMLWFVLNGDGSITVRNRFGNEKNRAEATFGQ